MDNVVNWFDLVKRMPKDFIYFCFMQVVAETTTGKYGNTVVPDLTAMDAISRFARIHGMKGHGKDEFYDSNRELNAKEEK